ncbi:MAG: sigma-70 family RNA polymerase sigma factor [Bacteroidota bacterium]
MNLTEFTRLGERHQADFEAQALRLTRDPEAAKDLLQEAAFNAYKNRHQYQPGTNFLAWAKTIIRNTFLSEYRRKKRRRALIETTHPHLNWTEKLVTHNPAEGNLGAEHIMELINQLPVEFRHPFMLHFQGVRYREIADRMGIPLGTAKSRVFTARQQLRKRLRVLYGDVA